MTVREIMESVESDQFALAIAQAWVESALERGFVARTGGSNESTRYNITAAGRNAAGVRTGRFLVTVPPVLSRLNETSERWSVWTGGGARPQ